MLRYYWRQQQACVVGTAVSMRRATSNQREEHNRSDTYFKKVSRILSDPRKGVKVAAELYRNEIRRELVEYAEHEDTRPIQDAVHLGGGSHGEECFVLLMKVLCDANRLEDVRFLFAVALRQFQAPSTELFNVLLIGITWSDTFTEDEIINVATIMNSRGVARDAVTELCLSLAFLRLQRQDYFKANWTETCRKCHEVIQRHMKDPAAHSLPVGFTIKLSQTFATLSRMTPHADDLWGTFLTIITPLATSAIERTRQERESNPASTLALALSEDALASRVVVTTRILVSALSACLANIAVSSQHIHKLFQLLKLQYALEYDLHADMNTNEGELREDAGSVSPSLPHQSAEPAASALVTRSSMLDSPCALSEANAARLFARCLRDPNLPLAQDLLAYTTQQHNLFTSPNAKSQVHVIVAEVAAIEARKASRSEAERIELIAQMFDALEGAQPEHTTTKALSSPITILCRAEDAAAGGSAPPSQNSPKSIVVHASPKVPELLFREAIAHINGADSLQTAWSILADRKSQNIVVTSASIQRVLEAAAAQGNTAFCSLVISDLQKKELWRQPTNGAPTPTLVTSDVYDALVRCILFEAERCAGSTDVQAKMSSLMHDMQHPRGAAGAAVSSPPLALNQSSLHSMLRYAVESGDTVFGVQVIGWYDERGVPLDRTVAAKLLRNLCHILDKNSVRAVLRSWEKLNGGVHPKVTRMCEMAFKRWGDELFA